ncbi:hypothetical protein RJT34_15997 [Clitoria ternatea]|uniref:Uncharacterized protein n=1 Tax=Clitoria ternatea TaxID=43366 RepID=A0AAN9PCI0_CLITE
MFKALKRMERLTDGEYFRDEDDLQCQINADSSNVDCGSDSNSGNSLNDVCGSGSHGENLLNVDCGNGSRNFGGNFFIKESSNAYN